MKYDTSLPIYLQVAESIKKDIGSGKLGIGAKLPSGRELAVVYKINPNTSVKVYQYLEQDGICYTKRGLGTFVCEDEKLMERIKKEMAEELISYFIQNMEELGFTKKEMSQLIMEEE